jgi:hypothetical protein
VAANCLTTMLTVLKIPMTYFVVSGVLIPPLPTNIKASMSGYEEQDVTSRLGPRTDVATLNPGEIRQLAFHLRRTKNVKPEKANR